MDTLKEFSEIVTKGFMQLNIDEKVSFVSSFKSFAKDIMISEYEKMFKDGELLTTRAKELSAFTQEKL